MPTAITRPAHAPAADPSAGRDLTVDFVRAIAMVLVVVGHWLVVVPTHRDGRFDGVNALETVALMRPLTWIFQVMPLFFAVGGYAAAASWAGARRRHQPYGRWLAARLDRLVRPLVVLVAAWVPAAVALRAISVDGGLVSTVSWLVVVPVWFLAVYAVVTAAAPAMFAAHERWGAGVLVVLVALAAVVDALRFADPRTPVAHLNFFAVFLFAQQLGFFWRDGRVDRCARTLVAVGLGALVVLTTVGPYPVSQVGVPGEAIANNAPPTLTLAALGIAQVGLAVVLRPLLARLLARRAVAGAVLVLNLRAMTVLLWHFTALAVVALVVLPLDIVPIAPDGSAAWWLLRIATVGVLAPVLAAVTAIAGRFERPRHTRGGTAIVEHPSARATGWLLLATACFAAACAWTTVRGLSPSGSLAGLPVPGLVLLAATMGARRLAWPKPVAAPV